MQLLIIFAAKYLFAIVAALATYVWWRLPKNLRLRVAMQAVLGLSLAAVLVKVAGALHPDVRPFVEHHFTPLVAQNGDNGFPSDHTTFTIGGVDDLALCAQVGLGACWPSAGSRRSSRGSRRSFTARYCGWNCGCSDRCLGGVLYGCMDYQHMADSSPK